MKQPVDHVARAVLPWRPEEQGLTECGLPAASYPTISREALKARLKELGQQRAAMLTCMTCWQTCQHWKPWEENPVSAIHREASRSVYSPTQTPFHHELRAIAALIAEHREEFDDKVRAFAAIPSLAEERRKRREQA